MSLVIICCVVLCAGSGLRGFREVGSAFFEDFFVVCMPCFIFLTSHVTADMGIVLLLKFFEGLFVVCMPCFIFLT